MNVLHTTAGVVPWPEEFAREYRERGYWKDRTLGEYILDAADRSPEKVALVCGDVRLTYAELVDRMDAAAVRLLENGFSADDRILVQLPNDWHFVVLTLACFRAGIVPVMALPAHRRHEMVHLAGHSQAVALAVPAEHRGFDHRVLAREVAAENPHVSRLLVVRDDESDALAEDEIDLDALLAPSDGSDVRARMDAVRPDPDSPACFLISGGTTGLPKLIVRTHNDYAYNVEATSAVSGVTAGTVYLGTLPASHNFPLACPGVLGALFAGGTAVMLPSPEPSRAFETIRREKVTLAAAVPAVAQRWLEYQRETGGDALTSLEVLQVGGSRMPDELAAQVRPVLGATLQQVFGMAEGLINMTRLDDPDEVIRTTQGRPVSPADEVRVVDAEGNDLPAGARGLILTRGPYTPRGYYDAAEHNERAFLDGWYGSGDVVEQHPDGNLVVFGRDKDIINRGGEKISAEEIENIVYRLDAVDLVAAIGVPDDVLGERVCLCLSLQDPGRTVTLEEVRDFVAAQGVAAFKLPESIEIMDALPLTKVGKIDKRMLRETLAARGRGGE
jgi:2,3-dihydroxybenzoate-AMP ligase